MSCEEMDVLRGYSPAMSDFSDMDDEELDLYLAHCGTLSNLPTPPQRAAHRPPPAAFLSTPPTPPPELEVSQMFSELQVYATHLVGLGKKQGSVEIAEGFLRRARVPVEVVAFAACILERLSEETQDVDAPELIILAALALAQGYLDDRGRSNTHWTVIEAAGRYETKCFQRAKMDILQDIDYGLFRIGEEEVDGMVKDMQRDLPAPLIAVVGIGESELEEEDDDDERCKASLSSGAAGHAIWAHGVQTPEPSP